MSNESSSSSTMPDSKADPQIAQQATVEIPSSSNEKTKVFGLYGIDGSGKTFLLKELKEELSGEDFIFFDGSEVIGDVFKDGLEAFKKRPEKEKEHWRKEAIQEIEKKCVDSGKTGIVAGHYMFWNDKDGELGNVACTQKDLEIFTHILYLNVPAKVVAERRKSDKSRNRLELSIDQLAKWQKEEMDQLRDSCRRNNILFSAISPPSEEPGASLLDKALPLLQDFQHHSKEKNLDKAKEVMDAAVDIGGGKWENLLVLDADGTLAPQDAGRLFWERIGSPLPSKEKGWPLKQLFGEPMKYSQNAFRQAVLLHEEFTNDQDFEKLCEEVASTVVVHPEFLELLRLGEQHEHVGAVVVTCGLRLVWEMVLKKEGFSERVKVIGGGRISDGYVVTGEVKADLVAHLKEKHDMYVVAFGDSPLDLAMMDAAHKAIVVAGDQQTRGKTMDKALGDAYEKDGFRPKQVALPKHASPRMDIVRIPLVDLAGHDFLAPVVSHHASIKVIHATEKNAAKVLMTPTRNKNNAGRNLRECHRQIGWYLATEYLTGTDVIGIETYPISHVQGHDVDGHQLKDEKRTTIVALMRGGEPMAFGVNDAFPLAMFVHAKNPEDLKIDHLRGRRTVILVDSVVNNGKTVIDFVRHVRSLHKDIRIVVVAGVVQNKATGIIKERLTEVESFSLVTLRLSTNKYTGKGTVDTGNRLFNSTTLD